MSLFPLLIRSTESSIESMMMGGGAGDHNLPIGSLICTGIIFFYIKVGYSNIFTTSKKIPTGNVRNLVIY